MGTELGDRRIGGEMGVSVGWMTSSVGNTLGGFPAIKLQASEATTIIDTIKEFSVNLLRCADIISLLL